MLVGRASAVEEGEGDEPRSCVGFSLVASFVLLRRSSALRVVSCPNDSTFCPSLRDDSLSQDWRAKGISRSRAKRMRTVYHPDSGMRSY